MGRAWRPQPKYRQAPHVALGMLEAGLGLLMTFAIMIMIVIISVPTVVQGPIRAEQSRSDQLTPSLAVPPCDSEVCTSSPNSTVPLDMGTHRETATTPMQPTAASGMAIELTPSSQRNSGGIMREWFEMQAKARARGGFLQQMTEFLRNQGKPSRP